MRSAHTKGVVEVDITVSKALVDSAPEAGTDELERLTGSRAYANAFRALYGVPISDEEHGIIRALRDPERRAKLLSVKEGTGA